MHAWLNCDAVYRPSSHCDINILQCTMSFTRTWLFGWRGPQRQRQRGHTGVQLSLQLPLAYVPGLHLRGLTLPDEHALPAGQIAHCVASSRLVASE